MRYNAAGGMLATGAQDTDIILWDVAGEAGLFRLRGHTGEVTDLVLFCPLMRHLEPFMAICRRMLLCVAQVHCGGGITPW